VPRNKSRIYRLAAAAAFLTGTAIGVAQAQPTSAADEFDQARRACIAAGRTEQQHEQAIAALQHDIELRSQAAAGAERGLRDTSVEQVHYLSVVLSLPSHPSGRPVIFSSEPPLTRLRREMLEQGLVPALRIEGRALASEVQRLAALRRDIATETSELAADRAALQQDKSELAAFTARLRALTVKALPEDTASEAHITRLPNAAKDLDDLIKRADAAIDRRDKQILARARHGLTRAAANALTIDAADPTRPAALRSFAPPETLLWPPVPAPLVRVFNSPDATGEARNALGFDATAGGLVVAPFDGRVIFAGSFRDLGLILIIGHPGGYHSVLTRLGRVDAQVGDWVLAGQPVGAMPQGGDKNSGVLLNFEVRRDGHPVDPQPWLAAAAPAASNARAQQGAGGAASGDRKGHE
jgi:septal ring factor EnvC (AmiA/AmiB activator)